MGFGVWELGFRVWGPPTLAACWMGKGSENLPLSLLTPPKRGGGVGGGTRAAFPWRGHPRINSRIIGGFAQDIGVPPPYPPPPPPPPTPPLPTPPPFAVVGA